MDWIQSNLGMIIPLCLLARILTALGTKGSITNTREPGLLRRTGFT